MLPSLLKISTLAIVLMPILTTATGMVPETSVVIVEQGEGTINVKNTDGFPVILLTTLENVPSDTENLLTATPPAIRVEPGKTQQIRFIVTNPATIKTERLKRVIFEGVPPQGKGKNEVRMTVRQNLPVIIRPDGLARDEAPWKHLAWKVSGSSLVVSNPSPYVVRLGQGVQTLPDNTKWTLPQTYVLPGQTLNLALDGGQKGGAAKQVRLSPATTWGFSVEHYDAPLTQ